jgi:ABC-type multidrug transport system ATPase subunit
VTHDVSETRGFDLVCVMEDGALVEVGTPAELEARDGSRYSALLRAEETVRGARWGSKDWRRVRVDAGMLHEEGGGA